MEPFGNSQAPGTQGQAPGGWQAGQAPSGGPSAPWSMPQNTPPPGYSTPLYSGTIQPGGMTASIIEKTAKWTALPLVARWFKILAWISLIGGALGFLIALIVGFAGATNPYVGGAAAGLGFVYGLFLLFGGAYGFLWNLFVSEIIGVFLAIEKNTRK